VTPSQWKIALIDDEPDIREVTELTLTDGGYQVACAADGMAGMELCRRWLPQIAITDIRMPRMDGLTLLQTLKDELPDIQVIVITAFGEMDVAIRALQLDASDFITKPINDQALHLALDRAQERYLARRQIQCHTEWLARENARNLQELQHTVALRKNLIENSIDAIVGCDAAGQIVIYNQAMAQLTGIGAAQAIGRLNVAHYFQTEHWQALQRELANAQPAGRLYLFETILSVNATAPIPVQLSSGTLDDGGRVFFLRDLRKIRQMERQMQDQARILHQDKMMALGKLAASVTHEINNPLAGVLNYCRLMQRILNRGPLDATGQAKFSRHLDLVETEISRCADIVSSLLTFSRHASPNFAAMQIEPMISRGVLICRHKLTLQQIELSVTIAPNLPMVFGDFNQLQQCLINLIFNAADAMPDGGKLSIEACLNPNRSHIVISVSDTGEGIDSASQPMVFEPFFTTKPAGRGTGLGLPTVQAIMQNHRGTVTFESQPGRGACFFLTLPIDSPQPAMPRGHT